MTRSRCLRVEGGPYLWVWYREEVVPVAENELDAALEECTTQAEYEMRRGEVDAVMKRAAHGLLSCEDPQEVGPIHSQPELFELRWQWEGGRKPFRLYHGEPDSTPSLVALHFHWKLVEGTYSEIRAAQDLELEVAASRYQKWDGGSL